MTYVIVSCVLASIVVGVLWSRRRKVQIVEVADTSQFRRGDKITWITSEGPVTVTVAKVPGATTIHVRGAQ